MQDAYLMVTCLSLCPVILTLSLSKYDTLQGSCLQMASTLQTFDAEKLNACFSGIRKWNLSPLLLPE